MSPNTPDLSAPALSRRLTLFVLALSACIAVLPLAVHGCSCGHDFDFHLLNWLEAAQQFRHGHLHPQWAFTPAWNAGEPRFVFYPPLSWSIGALLALLAGAASHLLPIAPATAFAATPIVYTWLVLFAGGAALFYVARAYSSGLAALLAASLYTTNPYALFTAYERTAYAELLSMALLPLLFAAALPRRTATESSNPSRTQKPSIAAIALLVALLWLSNAPAAILACYMLLLLGMIRLVFLLRGVNGTRAASHFTWRTVAGVLLGLALAAFFLLPALAERPWVQLSMAMLPGMRPQDNTLFHHTGDSAHDAVLHSASVIALLLLAATTLVLLLLSLRQRTIKRGRAGAVTTHTEHHRSQQEQIHITLAAATIILGLLLTPLAYPIWRNLPELAYLQFPWRLLAALAPIFALSVALVLRSLRLRPVPTIFAALALSLATALPAYRIFRQRCDSEDTPQARYAQFTAPSSKDPGSEPTDEYTPAAADNDSLADHNPPYRLLSLGDSPDASPPAGATSGPAPQSLRLDLSAPAMLVLNLRAYPAWLILRNGSPWRARVTRTDGLLEVMLPAGVSALELRYDTTPAERTGEAVSLCALGILVLVTRRELRQRSPRKLR